MKRMLLISVGIILAFLILGFTVKTTTYPPDDTRMVVDHTKRIYIAPPCFEEAEPSNFLEETTLEKARETGYELQAPCSEELLEGVTDPIFINWVKKTALFKTDWEW